MPVQQERQLSAGKTRTPAAHRLQANFRTFSVSKSCSCFLAFSVKTCTSDTANARDACTKKTSRQQANPKPLHLTGCTQSFAPCAAPTPAPASWPSHLGTASLTLQSPAMPVPKERQLSVGKTRTPAAHRLQAKNTVSMLSAARICQRDSEVLRRCYSCS
jgi:hypothetical protein